jgi:Xaa-Pro aminopeptidase
MLSVKNSTEIEGFRRAYLRDGVAFVSVPVRLRRVTDSLRKTQFLAWIDDKMEKKKYDIDEWEAANRLDEYRRKQLHYVTLAYENISGSGPNGALPHYSPQKGDARVIDHLTPYVK